MLNMIRLSCSAVCCTCSQSAISELVFPIFLTRSLSFWTAPCGGKRSFPDVSNRAKTEDCTEKCDSWLTNIAGYSCLDNASIFAGFAGAQRSDDGRRIIQSITHVHRCRRQDEMRHRMTWSFPTHLSQSRRLSLADRRTFGDHIPVKAAAVCIKWHKPMHKA